MQRLSTGQFHQPLPLTARPIGSLRLQATLFPAPQKEARMSLTGPLPPRACAPTCPQPAKADAASAAVRRGTQRELAFSEPARHRGAASSGRLCTFWRCGRGPSPRRAAGDQAFQVRPLTKGQWITFLSFFLKALLVDLVRGTSVTLPRRKGPVIGPQPCLPVRLGFPFGRLSWREQPAGESVSGAQWRR